MVFREWGFYINFLKLILRFVLLISIRLIFKIFMCVIEIYFFVEYKILYAFIRFSILVLRRVCVLFIMSLFS